MTEKLIINVRREGYGTDQISETMTVGELIDLLSDYDPETPVYLGNDNRGGYWYTYGGIRDYDLCEVNDDDESEE